MFDFKGILLRANGSSAKAARSEKGQTGGQTLMERCHRFLRKLESLK
jgi:hypothetical protein